MEQGVAIGRTGFGGRGALRHALVMALRKRIPDPVKKLHRLIKSVAVVYEPSPALPAQSFANARLMPHRGALVASLGKGGRVLEVGTDRGAFARQILKTCAPERLEVIDIDYSRFDPELRADPRLVRHQGLTETVMAQMADDSFDWVYVDAAHTYDHVWADAHAALRIVKPGGVVVFNDFAHIDPHLGRYGVHRAVAELIRDNKLAIYAMSYEPNGLYDIAVVKPPTAPTPQTEGARA